MNERGAAGGASMSAVPIKLSAWTPPLHGASFCFTESEASKREEEREALGRIRARACVEEVAARPAAVHGIWFRLIEQAPNERARSLLGNIEVP